ncbi:vWA domain-containing protein [Deinococcus maricopensis]|uniref:von Willebrand factor, type A n=1 Tax=Deinococcus maricopensis (strain DSM 21211 / LMG 22137 / NRRL B-23946 / LB-34) TaxID=709986 RepID=E8U7S4_DEIML|nr:vWA domain-containing protein [Deinococcus maricopensis]ADV67113.1 von Willebrand factor, type A [Deinococcus maricopensis DSM 21211]
MTARAALLLTLLLTTAHAQTTCTPPTPAPDRARTVILLDVSGSMMGQGDGRAVIFPAVKAQLTRLIARQTGELHLVTFDAGVRSQVTYTLPQDRARALQALQATAANGRNTWLYRSLEATFARLAPDDAAATTVYVLTDGQNNDPARRYTAERAMRAFERVRGPLDHLYYLALGTVVPKDARDALRAGGHGSATELPLGLAPNLTDGQFPPALLDVPDRLTPTVRLPGTTRAELDPDRAGRDLSVTLAPGGTVRLNVPHPVPVGTTSLLCTRTPEGARRILLRFPEGLSGPPASPAAPLRPLGVTQANARSWTLVPVTPAARTALARGGSTTLRYRLTGVPSARVRLAPLPAGLSGTVRGVNARGDAPRGAEISVHLRNDRLARGAVVTPALLVGNVQVPLPAIRPAGTPAEALPSPEPGAAPPPARLSPWLLLIVAAAAFGAFMNRHRLVIPPPRRPAPAPTPAAPPPPVRTATPHPDGAAAALIAPVPSGFGRPLAFSLLGRALTVHGDHVTHHTPLPDGEHDLGVTLALPALLGLTVVRGASGATLTALPHGVTLTYGSVTLQPGDPLPEGVPLALSGLHEPASTPGLPYHLTRGNEPIPLDAGVARAVPPAASAVDLGEASGIAALSGLTILADGGAYYLSRLPGGVRVSAGGQGLKLGTALVPAGTYVLDGPALPEPLQLTWDAR